MNPDGDFVNPRTFEIAACSAFQLVDARSELGDLFHPGREIVPFQDIEDLRDKTRYYLDHPEARLEISRRSHRRVVREHTMEHRMKELLVAVFLDRRDDLVRRIENRADPLELMIEEAGETTELGRFLKDFRGVSDFSLQTVVDRIGQGEGDLSRNEILMLMLNQVIKQKEAPWPEIF
ncbi:MAG: glycosyltransferase [Nitrospinaceae bacterium]|nr:glycosyltransferase family 1 protein [Nitrospinaceae bacterium]NIR53442.1 glycosyltransferase family 1 protein [Nitrospinaceae bacterium]NIS86207.1 glycosyltransferase family 1 protein [Nitrospinaceae bacterium]NIT83042.1 glycosyltransferase family 1 protein [Nitrospinaceae bacterium]NIU42963.1 glycosyltransferase family 1 protein [Nitrospinaceae bacterium]